MVASARKKKGRRERKTKRKRERDNKEAALTRKSGTSQTMRVRDTLRALAKIALHPYDIHWLPRCRVLFTSICITCKNLRQEIKSMFKGTKLFQRPSHRLKDGFSLILMALWMKKTNHAVMVLQKFIDSSPRALFSLRLFFSINHRYFSMGSEKKCCPEMSHLNVDNKNKKNKYIWLRKSAKVCETTSDGCGSKSSQGYIIQEMSRVDEGHRWSERGGVIRSAETLSRLENEFAQR